MGKSIGKKNRAAEAKAIGRRIRAARKEAGLAVQETAKRADLSANHLYVLERGEMYPSLPTIGRLARALNVTRDALLGSARKRNGTA